MASTKLRIEGMTCLNCVTHVQKSLDSVPGVKSVSVVQEEGATVDHDGADEGELVRAVEAKGGYKAKVVR